MRDYLAKLGRGRAQEVQPTASTASAGCQDGGAPASCSTPISTPIRGEADKDPFGGDVDDECIYGIGVSNMKAADAAYVAGCRRFKRAESGSGDVILPTSSASCRRVGTVHMLSRASAPTGSSSGSRRQLGAHATRGSLERS